MKRQRQSDSGEPATKRRRADDRSRTSTTTTDHHDKQPEFTATKYHSSPNVYKIQSIRPNHYKCLLMLVNVLTVVDVNLTKDLHYLGNNSESLTENDLLQFVSQSIFASNGRVTAPPGRLQLAMQAFDRSRNEQAIQAFQLIISYVKQDLAIRLHKDRESIRQAFSEVTKSSQPKRRIRQFLHSPGKQKPDDNKFVLNILEDGTYFCFWTVVTDSNDQKQVFELCFDFSSVRSDAEYEESDIEDMRKVYELMLYDEAIVYRRVQSFDVKPNYELNVDKEEIYYDWYFNQVQIDRNSVLQVLVTTTLSRALEASSRLPTHFRDRAAIKQSTHALQKIDDIVDHNSLELSQLQNNSYKTVVDRIQKALEKYLLHVRQSCNLDTPADQFQQLPDIDIMLEEIEFVISVVQSDSQYETEQISRLLELCSKQQVYLESRIEPYKKFNAHNILAKVKQLCAELKELDTTFTQYQKDSKHFTCAAIRDAQKEIQYYQKTKDSVYSALSELLPKPRASTSTAIPPTRSPTTTTRSTQQHRAQPQLHHVEEQEETKSDFCVLQ